ncbi:MAG: flavodoxin domain-containing protein [Candidatus Nanopelagicales bacterium]
MHTVVVYESMYGNSHRVADVVGDELRDAGPVEVVPVSAATNDLIAGADLVVVGGPTHVHTMSSSKTRAAAQTQAPGSVQKHGPEPLPMDQHWQDPGLRDWFKVLPQADGQSAAAFDTRFDARALLTGRASKLIARKLAKHDFTLIAEPESFLVDKQTRLLDSEVERAAHWARGLRTAMEAEHGAAGSWTAR